MAGERLNNGNIALFETSVEMIVLSEADFDHFTALLENPPPPSPRMKLAMAEYKATHGDQEK